MGYILTRSLASVKTESILPQVKELNPKHWAAQSIATALEVSSKNLNNQPVSTVVLQGGQSSSLGKGNTAPEPPTPLNNEQKLQFIQEKTWVESTAQNMERNQEASSTPAPVVNPGTSLPVQTAPQAVILPEEVILGE